MHAEMNAKQQQQQNIHGHTLTIQNNILIWCYEALHRLPTSPMQKKSSIYNLNNHHHAIACRVHSFM